MACVYYQPNRKYITISFIPNTHNRSRFWKSQMDVCKLCLSVCLSVNVCLAQCVRCVRVWVRVWCTCAVCVHVCASARICASVRLCMLMRVHVHVQMRIRLRLHASVCVCVCVCGGGGVVKFNMRISPVKLWFSYFLQSSKITTWLGFVWVGSRQIKILPVRVV